MLVVLVRVNVLVAVRVFDRLRAAQEDEMTVRRGVCVTVYVGSVPVGCLRHAVEGSEPDGQIETVSRGECFAHRHLRRGSPSQIHTKPGGTLRS